MPECRTKVLTAFVFLLACLSSFSLNAAAAGRTYAAHSVLASGQWYKLGVKTTGIQKITYNDLVNMGLNPASIDPRNIRIYGNGGGALPLLSGLPRVDDLAENMIQVVGESDGVFNQSDYILFYGEGPLRWQYDKSTGLFHHLQNYYSDYSFYFLTTDLGPGRRIAQVAPTTLPATDYVTRFNDFAVHDEDDTNLIKSGKIWYGEVFDILNTYSFNFSFPDIDPSAVVTLETDVAARSTVNSTFTVTANGHTMIPVVEYIIINKDADYAKASNDKMMFSSSDPVISVNMTYNKPYSGASAWLNYIEINAMRHLSFQGGQLRFRETSSGAAGKVTEYTLSNADAVQGIWDVTDRFSVNQLQASPSGGNIVFRIPTDTIHEFVAFDGTVWYTPDFRGKVTNQDLHACEPADMVIVAHPEFLTEAERLAGYHRESDHFSVLVVQPGQIYNEFSSGAQDPVAIRDFMKMLYDRAGTGQKPKYLLLFGDGSFDYKDKLKENTNYIPSFQSDNSLHPILSFVSDDYFGFLDDNEGSSSNAAVDVGIGRFPVKSPEEAAGLVDKVIRYSSKTDLIGPDNPAYTEEISNFGDWRNVLCFVADDGDDGENFAGDTDNLADEVGSEHKKYNIDKIYLDAFPQIITPGGQRYPDVKDAINKRVERGALIMSYIGHGGETGWAQERVLEVADISSWKNQNNLPVFITATCEFGRFDDPSRTSAGEYVILNPGGGGIALFTTTRSTYVDMALMDRLFDECLAPSLDPDLHPTLGDVIRQAKAPNGSSSNTLKYILFGDPAVRIAIPRYNVSTAYVNSQPSGSDTLKAFSRVTVAGSIVDGNGSKVAAFNGIIYPSVFDKSALSATRGNDPKSPVVQFSSQKSLLYRGKVSVSNGDFSFSFVVPRDIAYKFGKGRISYYARTDSTEANGYDESFTVGGMENITGTDENGPEVRLYMNDTLFINGGITNQNPLFLAFISDTSGINTVGTGIGHDLMAVLDDNTDYPYVLNDYYEADLDTYKSGVIVYPFTDLSEGGHRICLRVWDIYNNSSNTCLDFIVANSENFALKKVLNYPNPFRDHTCFTFEHNQPDQDLDVRIDIYSITGILVKTIRGILPAGGFQSAPVQWDGKGDFGQRIDRGVYIYRVCLKNAAGDQAMKSEKLVLLR